MFVIKASNRPEGHLQEFDLCYDLSSKKSMLWVLPCTLSCWFFSSTFLLYKRVKTCLDTLYNVLHMYDAGVKRVTAHVINVVARTCLNERRALPFPSRFLFFHLSKACKIASRAKHTSRYWLPEGGHLLSSLLPDRDAFRKIITYLY